MWTTSTAKSMTAVGFLWLCLFLRLQRALAMNVGIDEATGMPMFGVASDDLDDTDPSKQNSGWLPGGGAQIEAIPDQDEFYELSAKEVRTGKRISMERFEGYYTIITNTVRSCDTDRASEYFDEMERLYAAYPYSLEVIVFPFNDPDHPVDSCIDEVRALEAKAGRKIHVMEPVQQGLLMHPMYKFFGELFEIEEFQMNQNYNFFINPDGNSMALDFGFDFLKDPEFFSGLQGRAKVNRGPQF